MALIWILSAIIFTVTGFNPATANARDQIHIAGSHTLEPFVEYVSQHYSNETSFPSPTYKSIGSNEALEMLVKGDEYSHIDIAMLSRQIDSLEFKPIKFGGADDIIQIPVGLDGIIVANSREGKKFRLTLNDLFFALSADVPVNGRLVKNPYTTWNQIRNDLPNQKILVYGPTSNSGTRRVFVDKVISEIARTMPAYNHYVGRYEKIRQDGAYVAFVEHDLNMLDEVLKNRNAVGIISYSMYMKNKDEFKYATIEGYAPTYDNIVSGQYPISRKLFMCVHGEDLATTSCLRTYIELFMREDMIGDHGELSILGHIPLSRPERLRNRIKWLNLVGEL